MTTPKRHEQVSDLFLAVCDLTEEARTRYLRDHCPDDELRMDVLILLRQEADRSDFLDRPPSLDALGKKVPWARPERVAAYRILGELGVGGMGVVYLAEQDRPKRRVALKLIQPAWVTPTVLRRFELEAQILGRLQHPGIAQIFEAGTADVGLGPQPFFAMEYIEGLPLTEYVESKKLGTRDRLSLFARICEGVQHAHQKGVIHRDLKPANILVSDPPNPPLSKGGLGGVGQPKILDFGVARAIDSDLQTTTLQTDIGQLIGTVPYMSPEQVAGDPHDLDTRSDVYSLGIVLYELLGGRLPFDFGRKMVHEAVRMIREDEPTRLSSINRVFRGDIETIVNKALEKDKSRRYQSASDFAADIRRYLADEPIVARPASAVYQFRKFARRNRALVGGIAAVIVALAVGSVATGVQAIRVTRQRDRAIAAENESTALSTPILQMFDHMDRWTNRSAREAFLTILNGAGPDFMEMNGAPERKASLLLKVGKAYRLLGGPGAELDATEQSEPYLRASIYTYRAIRSPPEPMDEAETELATALSDLARLRSAPDEESKQLRSRRFDEATHLAQRVFESRSARLGGEHTLTLTSEHLLGSILSDQGANEEAERVLNEVLVARNRVLGPDHDDTLGTVGYLGQLRLTAGDYAAAADLSGRVYEVRRNRLDAEPALVAGAGVNYADVLVKCGRLDEAEAVYRWVISFRNEHMGEDDIGTSMIRQNFAALVLGAQDRWEEAAITFREVLQLRKRQLPAGHDNVQRPMYSLAQALRHLGRYDDALTLYQELIPLADGYLPPAHEHRSRFRREFGICLHEVGRYEEAVQQLMAAYELLPSVDARPDLRPSIIQALVDTYYAWGKPDQREHWRQVMEGQETMPPKSKSMASQK